MNLRLSLKNKLVLLVIVAAVPFIFTTIYLLVTFSGYVKSYDSIISNMTVANAYNLDFKEELDEGLYRMVARDMTADELMGIKNPYTILAELRRDFLNLKDITLDEQSLSYLDQILKNTDTLELRMNDISENIKVGGRYDKNITMLENNIYILTELIQDNIQRYIYYQTISMEKLKEALRRNVYSFLYVFIIIMVALAAGVMVMGIGIGRGILKPVRELSIASHQIAKGDFSVRVSADSGDELAYLSDSINEMTVKLYELVNQIKEDEHKMRNTELRLLQEQINPHFLYNTLDTIVWLIESSKFEEAEDMVVSLSSFFRLVLSHGQEMITLSEEERHIRSYLEIQKVRYRDILDYDINFPPEFSGCRLLKLTLQPIVENALYHGIKNKRAKGIIRITADRDRVKNDILLTVEDDGIGMDEAELLKLCSEIEKPCSDTSKGFGLANVNERLKMKFGSDYGVKIDSVSGRGTVVTVRIPEKYVLG